MLYTTDAEKSDFLGLLCKLSIGIILLDMGKTLEALDILKNGQK